MAMELSLTVPFAFGPGAGRDDEPQPVELSFGDGQKIVFMLRPFSRAVFEELENAGFDPDPFNDTLGPVEDYKRDKFLAPRLIAGWSPAIARSDGSFWEYRGDSDAVSIAGHGGVMAMIKLGAMQLVMGAQENREGNSESGSGTTTDGTPASGPVPSAAPADSVSD